MTENIDAEQLFKEFKHVPLSEFFKKNRQYLGYVGKIKSLTTVVHELVTNALDACEESGILPDLAVTIKQVGNEHYMVTVKDNGPGIPESHLHLVFGQLLAGTKFHRNIQLRGQQGLGVSGAVLFSQITTGKPTRVKSGIGKGKVYDVQIQLDIKNNQPQIMEKEEINDMWRGTLVESEFKGVQYTKGMQGPFEYIRRTAAANPHCRIFFKDPEGHETVFERVIESVPKKPAEIKPHPSGLETQDLLDLAHQSKARQISTFLTSDLTRVSSQKVKEAEVEINKIRTQHFKDSIDLKKSPKRLEWEEANDIVDAFKKVKFMAPSASGLIPIGKKHIQAALESLIAPDFIGVVTRSPTVFKGGIPFQIEVAIAYGGNAGRKTPDGPRMELMRFANRTPLLFDSGSCVINDSMNSIDWKRYKVSDLEKSPLTIFINLISTHIPYTSTGKQAVAKETEIHTEIRFAIMQITRDLQAYLSGKRRAQEKEAKKKLFEKYVPETAKALVKLTGGDEKKLIELLEKIVLEKFNDIDEEAEANGEEETFEEVDEESEVSVEEENGE